MRLGYIFRGGRVRPYFVLRCGGHIAWKTNDVGVAVSGSNGDPTGPAGSATNLERSSTWPENYGVSLLVGSSSNWLQLEHMESLVFVAVPFQAIRE